ncbi:hypothetical protein [Cutibacterium sp.]|nr:hypothetical protein [Cutibacterium sp.]MDO4413056.1 hypothetical protein [Cutibacterium sp.]
MKITWPTWMSLALLGLALADDSPRLWMIPAVGVAVCAGLDVRRAHQGRA